MSTQTFTPGAHTLTTKRTDISFVNMRRAPSSSATIEAQIMLPAVVEVRNDQVPTPGGSYLWVPVRHAGKDGWTAAQDHLVWRRRDRRQYNILQHVAPPGDGVSRIVVTGCNFGPDGEMFQMQRLGSHLRLYKGHHANTCNVQTYRIAAAGLIAQDDTSPFEDGLIYRINSGNGAVWLEPYMAVGDSVLFVGPINWHRRDNGTAVPGQESIAMPQALTVIEHHSEWRSRFGFEVMNVLEVQSEPAPGPSPRETWFLACDPRGIIGLVGWEERDKGLWTSIKGLMPPATPALRLNAVPWAGITNWNAPNLIRVPTWQPPLDPDDPSPPPPGPSPDTKPIWEHFSFTGPPSHVEHSADGKRSIEAPQGFRVRWQGYHINGVVSDRPFVYNKDGYYQILFAHTSGELIFEVAQELTWHGSGRHAIETMLDLAGAFNRRDLIQFGARIRLKDGRSVLVPDRFNAEQHVGALTIPIDIADPDAIDRIELVFILPEASTHNEGQSGEVRLRRFACRTAPADFAIPDYEPITVPRDVPQPQEPDPQEPDPQEPDPQEPGERWTDFLTERERDEVSFARVYAQTFAHGTDGHSRLMLIDKLARFLDAVEI